MGLRGRHVGGPLLRGRHVGGPVLRGRHIGGPPNDLALVGDDLAPFRDDLAPFGAGRVLLVSVARAVLSMTVGLALTAGVPVAFGWRSGVVISGSMQPALRIGDVVVSAQPSAGEPRPGQVVAVEDPERPGRVLVHRLVRLDENGDLITQGDANVHPDSSPVPFHDVEGVGRAYLRNDGKIVFGVYNGAVISVTTAAAYNDGAWHHIAGTGGPAGLMLYLDGVLVASNASATTSQTTTGYFHRGGGNAGWSSRPSSDYLDGDIDEVAFHLTQLSAQDVAWHYHANH